MCCLKYEQEAYEDLLKTAPKNESFVDTPDGRGTVTEVNLLRQCVKVRMEESSDTIGCYKNCDICVLRSGKARKMTRRSRRTLLRSPRSHASCSRRKRACLSLCRS